MRLCVVGAGAIGGVLAARLALAGEEVTLLVRGAAQRQAVDREGLTLIETSGERCLVRGLRTASEASEAGIQDFVILAVKAHHIPALVPGIRALFGAETAVMTLQNGLPWWYFERLGGPYDGLRLAALDPHGAVAAAIAARRVIGAVAYMAAVREGPAVVRRGGGNRIPLGELDGSESARLRLLAATLARAGFEAPVTEDIRAELWLKLWGNACFNPIAALTHSTIGGICGHPASRALALAMMEEIAALAASLGVAFRQTVAERMAVSERVAQHKPSMAQDVEAGRALEVEALSGALVELGRLTATPMPHLAAVHACVKLLDATMAAERCAFVVQKSAAP
ncbi:MAG: 2-dehydropantoate 2-reductase [Alphaproteobacteria bacterium]